MNIRQLIALQCGILAAVAAILFPPYGYDRVVSINFPSGKEIQLGPTVFEPTNACPWRYVRHSFILSTPTRDEALDGRNKEDNENWPETGKSIFRPEIKIAGHVLAAEVAVVVLLTTGTFITFGYKRNLPKAPASGSGKLPNPPSVAQRGHPAIMKGSLTAKDAAGWYNLGVVYLESGRTDEAIDAYQEAVTIKPDDAEAWYALGFAYGKAGRTEDAIAAYLQAVRIKPDYVDAWHNLGINYRHLNNIKDAADAFQRAGALEPSQGT